MAVLIGDNKQDQVVGSIYFALIFIVILGVFIWMQMRDRSADSAHIQRNAENAVAQSR